MKPSGNQTTQIIRDTIHANPSIHFRELLRRAGLSSAGQLRHHLDCLSRDGCIVEVEDGGFSRYFPAGIYDRDLRQEMVRFSRPIPRRLARLLLEGRMPRTEIRRSLQCPDSTLGYYLSRLRNEGILERQTIDPHTFYSLANPDHVRRILEARPDQGNPLEQDLIPTALA